MATQTHTISASALIEAPAELLYGIIADYRNGHPYILPKPYFQSLEVEKGGVGEGTVIFVTMRLMGRTSSFRAAVTEPEPGRVLVESDLDPKTGLVTRFIVEPVDSGPQTRVTFYTTMNTRAGWLGAVERFMITRLLHPVYLKELAQLAAVAKERLKSTP